MSLSVRVALIGFSALVAGCAAMDPYIRHNRPPRSVQVEACMNPAGPALFGSHALWSACEMLIRMERARSEIVRSRSALTTVLFPAAGVVAYNSARGFNAPTSTAITAGGLAAYSTITTLAQPDRIKVYNQGLESLSCAIGTYGEAFGSLPPPSLDRVFLQEHLRTLRSDLAQAQEEAKGRDVKKYAAIVSAERIVDTVGQQSSGVANASALDAALSKLVGATVVSVNSQLTGTLPTSEQAFGAAVSVLQVKSDNKRRNGERSLKFGELLVLRLEQAGLDHSIGARLLEVLALQESVAKEPKHAVSADFSKCAYVPVDGVTFDNAAQPFMLGAGDSLNNMQVELAKDGKIEERIFGGYPPYSRSVRGPTPHVGTEIEVRDGAAYLVLTPPEPFPETEISYEVIVSDSIGKRAKTVTVTVNSN